MRYFYCFAAIFCALSASAQSAFDEVVNTIISNNTDLQSMQHAIAALRLDDADANSLADPQVSFARVWGRNHIGNKLQLDVSQEFEWPGVYSARSKAADMGINVAVSEYDVTRADLSYQLWQLLIELVYVRQQLAVSDELMANFNTLNEAIDKAVKGGELTILDQRKMLIERYEIENQRSAIVSREQQIISDINALSTVAVDLSAIVDYPLQPLLSRQQYIDQIADLPEVHTMVLAAEHESINAKVASQSRMPSFSVGYQHQAEMGDRFNGFTLGMNLPFFQGRHARRAAIERKDAADLNREMLVSKRMAEIDGTYAQIDIYRSRIEAYNMVFGDKQYLNLLLKAYDGGALSVIEYLSEIHYYHQTMLTFAEAEYNYNQALTTLNRYSH